VLRSQKEKKEKLDVALRDSVQESLVASTGKNLPPDPDAWEALLHQPGNGTAVADSSKKENVLVGWFTGLVSGNHSKADSAVPPPTPSPSGPPSPGGAPYPAGVQNPAGPANAPANPYAPPGPYPATLPPAQPVTRQ